MVIKYCISVLHTQKLYSPYRNHCYVTVCLCPILSKQDPHESIRAENHVRRPSIRIYKGL